MSGPPGRPVRVCGVAALWGAVVHGVVAPVEGVVCSDGGHGGLLLLAIGGVLRQVVLHTALSRHCLDACGVHPAGGASWHLMSVSCANPLPAASCHSADPGQVLQMPHHRPPTQQASLQQQHLYLQLQLRTLWHAAKVVRWQ